MWNFACINPPCEYMLGLQQLVTRWNTLNQTVYT